MAGRRKFQPITTEKQLDAALSWIDDLMEKDERGGGLTKAETALLDALATLVEAYEDKVRPLDRGLDPVRVILQVMKERQLRAADLVRMGVFSSPERASDKLKYKRRLTLDNIRAVHEHLHVPLEVLIAEYRYGDQRRRRKSG